MPLRPQNYFLRRDPKIWFDERDHIGHDEIRLEMYFPMTIVPTLHVGNAKERQLLQKRLMILRLTWMQFQDAHMHVRIVGQNQKVLDLKYGWGSSSSFSNF
ncbi:uncharacterized protein [Rutidosis leptorrhynchoides]|uniref:uncharacterized protein isoform X2 n=1 Tax=Rutidosis leptorrhynchoides TaxID=125765 RepID=UPI003A993803